MPDGYDGSRPLTQSRVEPQSHPFAVTPSAATRRVIAVGPRKASISLEDAFWSALRDIACDRGLTLTRLVAAIDVHRRGTNLPSALRLFVLDYFRARSLAVLIGQRVTPLPPPRQSVAAPGARLNFKV
ncbi:MAG: aryl-sulfate sulfotransferase [Xanthobacteraceae bacterium]|nr:MAG: aryl-sulfate sulfotransferase [Xanthobacteraceae bacterium]